ncbi:PIN domain-containing protein [Marinilabilia salmonicolor]|uniref:DUF4935 domain-containing protein n=1 Tax=Marinilabilia salmonicolor TaxID=989 RepID=A0A368ULI0_9BACT|nr:PIN domain-containing protein [Marinilabilia salmonicolor]RCW29648.1 hypothetical protein DFO77_1265 [Marinilabilia salmonicolor]
MNITLFIDTNILFVKHFYKFKQVNFIYNLKRLINDISVNNFPLTISIILPKIVVDELLQQQIESYNDKMKELNRFDFPNFEIIESVNYPNYLNEILTNELKQVDKPQTRTQIIEYSKNLKIDEIIERAIKKQPPFEGKEKDSDKGFKDVILWEMMVDYQKANKNTKTILCTNDQIFKTSFLIEEFTKRVSSTFKVVNWHKGNSDIIRLLGEILNKPTTLSIESQIIKGFEDLIYKSNLNSLFLDLKFTNPINQSIYFFKQLEIIEFNLISNIAQHEHKGDKGYYYFVVEIKIKYDFVDEVFLKSDIGDIISTSDFYEYEIIFNPKTNIYSIISYDSLEKTEFVNDGIELKKAANNV